MNFLIHSINRRHCHRVNVGWLMAGFVFLIGLVVMPAAIAASTPSSGLLKQPVIEVKVSLGNAADELKFVPDNLEFVSGKHYKLILTNPSSQKHYFTAKDFADNIWNQKVEAGKVEIKGAIHELELKPGAEAEWVFVPIKPGTYQLRCTISGHAEAGMVGAIAIK
ncbi:cupredoxin domain-containing protein [Leptothermofonsia sp. ETS-13]|uniref:cupredoxin domain-containing protein n=1 Tax=Leptothermofonsia sp. ETS-13 TaxID=3035696 RepID=UPI003B9DF846